jgi:serine/threonine-protein kinase
MPDIDEGLIRDAMDALGVEEVKELRPGGQKVVRLVRRDETHLVLKVIPVGSSTPDALRRAEREVSFLRSLDNPHIVQVASDLVELGEPVQGAAWLEEYLDGEDLANTFTERWGWDQAAKMGLHVARGLAAAHSNAVVHRDLSANNVRRLSDGSFKVMDFGFARYTLRSGITFAGQPGTPGYMSPEHLRAYSGAPTAASDVFSVGILMFQALTGNVPIPYEGDDARYIKKLSAVDIPEISTLRADLPPSAVSVMRRCLHPQPARRFLNGSRLASALEEFE